MTVDIKPVAWVRPSSLEAGAVTIKYRISKWSHVLTGETMYGIQGKPPGEHRYLHCCEGVEPLIFKTKEEAAAKLQEIRARAPHPAAQDEG